MRTEEQSLKSELMPWEITRLAERVEKEETNG